MRRADPLADALRGLPWRPAGPPELVSRGLGGAPANGASYGADLDGDQIHDGLDAANRPEGRDGPHCVAFVSAASNLVPGDTNGLPDAFVADLRSGRIERVRSTRVGGRRAARPTRSRSTGRCRRVAFTSDAPGLALTRTTFKRAAPPALPRPAWSRARRGAGSARSTRACCRSAREPDHAGLRGITFLASRGAPAAPPTGRATTSRSASSAAAATAARAAASPRATRSPTRPRRPTSRPATAARRPDVYKTSFARTYSKRRGRRRRYAPARARHDARVGDARRPRRQRRVGARGDQPERPLRRVRDRRDRRAAVRRAPGGDRLRHERRDRRRAGRHLGAAAARAVGLGVGRDRAARQRRIGPPVDDRLRVGLLRVRRDQPPAPAGRAAACSATATASATSSSGRCRRSSQSLQSRDSTTRSR